jgi:hypothetical protein
MAMFTDDETIRGRYHDHPKIGHLISKIDRYVITGAHLGDFLTSVLINSLSGAVARADENSLAHLKMFVQYVYNYIPACAWGSEEKMETWRELEQSERDRIVSESFPHMLLEVA